MGWLFGKKKVPQVPFPQGQLVGGKTLRFPTPSSTEKIIEPKQVKAAVGFEKPIPRPIPNQIPSSSSPDPRPAFSPRAEMPPRPSQPMQRVAPTQQPSSPESFSARPSINPFQSDEGPLFVKVNVYQRILGEMELLRRELVQLSHYNRELENSEYNEEASFVKLRNSMRHVHDRLLDADKKLFGTR
jgi:hypothetical protein